MALARQFEASATRGSTEIDGVRLQVREAGAGRPVVVIGGGTQADALLSGLSERNRVIAIDTSGATSARELARGVAQVLTKLAVERASAIGVSGGASIALAHAILAPDRIDKLILLSPPAALDAELRAGLSQIKAPTLVMVGTRDRSGAAETMRAIKEQAGACHVLLIYDAGDAILVDRPEACIPPISEFLERGVEFVVCHESQVIRR